MAKLKGRKSVYHPHIYHRPRLPGETERSVISWCRDVLGRHSERKETIQKRQAIVERHSSGKNKIAVACFEVRKLELENRWIGGGRTSQEGDQHWRYWRSDSSPRRQGPQSPAHGSGLKNQVHARAVPAPSGLLTAKPPPSHSRPSSRPTPWGPLTQTGSVSRATRGGPPSFRSPVCVTSGR